MEFRNIWKIKKGQNLEINKDKRGKIVDIFYKKNINHVAFITSKPMTLRGNHYHKKSTQHIFITKGSLEYWYKKLNSNIIKKKIIKVGDIITTPPLEIHALKILNQGCEFLAFSEGLRGGKDYEKDTFRVENIIKL